MPDIESKISRHTKNQENKTHNEGKNQTIEMDPKMIQIDNDLRKKVLSKESHSEEKTVR